MANKKNLANGILAANITSSATSMTLEAGYGSAMPAVPFSLTITPPGQLSTMGNSEIVTVTARTSDTLTITRAQKGTSAKAFNAGAVVSNSIYADDKLTIDDIDFTSFAMTSENGWNRYRNPYNGKIRYWREGSANGPSLPSQWFAYITTGISFPAGTRVVSCLWRVEDQALSVTPQSSNNIQAVTQSHYSNAAANCIYYYELEQV